jgi:hypothetical protein
MAWIVDVTRVVHPADQYKVDPRLGTVKKLYTRDGEEMCKVLWDGQAVQVTYPVANLIEQVA